MSILIYKNDQQEGPYDLDTIMQGLASGQFAPNDFAFQDGCEDWVPLHTFLPAEPEPPVQPIQSNIKKKIDEKLEQVDAGFSKLLVDAQDPGVVKKVMENAKELLTRGEEVEYIGIQKKLLITIAPDAVLVTNKRFMIVRRKVMSMTFADHIWREVANVHMSEQMLTATITCEVVGGKKLAIDSIPKKQARKVYSYAQEVEERMHEERRAREMEDKRAAAGGVIVHSPSPIQQAAAPVADDPMEVLGKLKKMLDAGLIQQSEYEAKKTEVLSKM